MTAACPLPFTMTPTGTRLRLVDNGWHVIAVLGKAPNVGAGWERYCDSPPTAFEVRRWEGWAGPSTGIALGKCAIAIDPDIFHSGAEMAAKAQALAFEIFGPTPFIRVGQAPKRAFVYRVAPAGITSTKWKLADGCGDGVDILSAGTQMVAFGKHVTTGRDYEWVGECSPLDEGPDAAPIITQAKVDQFLERFNAEIAPLVKASSGGGGRGGSDNDGGTILRNDAGLVVDGGYHAFSLVVTKEAARELHAEVLEPTADAIFVRAWAAWNDLATGAVWRDGKARSYVRKEARYTAGRIASGHLNVSRQEAESAPPEPGAPPLVPTFPDCDIPVNEARIAVEAAIRGFVNGIATRVREKPNAFEVYAGVRPPLRPYVKAIRVTTGTGKTSIMAKVVAELVHGWRAQEAAKRARRATRLVVPRRPDSIKRVLVAVPTHKLGDEIVETFRREDVSARVFRGRKAVDPARLREVDPDGRSPPMCDDIDAIELAMTLGLSVNQSCCSGKSPKTGSTVQCAFYESCAYQRQKVDAPDVWLVAHDLLFRQQDAICGVEIVIIDETFFDSGIRHPGEGLTLDELVTAPIVSAIGKADIAERVKVFRRTLANALRRQEQTGGVAQEHLVVEDIDAAVCTSAISDEWELKGRAEVWPGMSAAARTAAKKLVGQSVDLRGITALWGAARELVGAPAGTISGRLFLADVQMPDGAGRSRRVRVRGISRIAAQWRDKPTLLMDATLPDTAILQAFYPGIEVVADIAVAHPHAVVRQVVGAPTSKFKLFPPDGGGERNRNAIRDGIIRRFVEAGRPKTLVVVQMELEVWLKKHWLPTEIEVRHYNALAGIDRFKDVGLLIAVGRTLPTILDVEGTAGAITGVKPMMTALPTGKGQRRWYDKAARIIRTADNAGYAVDCEAHPDPLVEALRFQIAEAEIVQSIGRGRAVNRTAAHPLLIEIWAIVVLPVTVDEVVKWSVFQAGADPRFEMFARGAVLESPTDMAAAAWPQKWVSEEAARSAVKRAKQAAGTGTSGQNPIKGFSYRTLTGCSVSYQKKGSNQKHRAARFDLAVIPDPRAWLEARLGPLASFQIVQPAAVLRLKLLMARSLFEKLKPTELTEPWRIRREQVLTMLARAA